jgi:ribose transport system permease protein
MSIVNKKWSGEGNFFKRLMSMREGILVVVIIAMFLVMSITNEYFLLPQTMLNLLMSLTVEGVIAIGMGILLVAGGLDLSAGANMAFSGIIAGLLYINGMPLMMAVIIALLVGFGIGFFNGIMIAMVGLNPLITTLGTQMTFSGLMMIITKGKAVTLTGDFPKIGQGELFGMQYPIYILAALVIVFDTLLRRSRFFRRSYYVGGNAEASKLNGINTRNVLLVNYAITGLLAGLAGILLASRLSTASVTVGGDTALRVITACIIGGASLNGGEGTVLGSFLGVVFLQLLSSSLNIMGVDTHVKTFVTGLILIAAITLDVLNERRKLAKMTVEKQQSIIEEN